MKKFLRNVVTLGVLEYLYCFSVHYNLNFNTPMQQSAAFKILKTRLKAVPLYSFNGEQIKRTPSGNPYQILQMAGGSQVTEVGDLTLDGGKSLNGINFTARLQQFEKMQYQHRMHAKVHDQLRNSSTSSPKVVIPLHFVTYILPLALLCTNKLLEARICTIAKLVMKTTKKHKYLRGCPTGFGPIFILYTYTKRNTCIYVLVFVYLYKFETPMYKLVLYLLPGK